MANSVENDECNFGVLVVVAREVATFLDVDSLVAFAQTNREFWRSLAAPPPPPLCKPSRDGAQDTYVETMWKRIVQGQFLLYPEQLQELEESRWADPVEDTTNGDGDGSESASIPWAPSVSWKTMALSMNNMMKGRYRIAFLNDESRRSLFPDYDIASSCSSDSEFSDGGCKEDSDVDDDYDDDELEDMQEKEEEELLTSSRDPPPEPSDRITLEEGFSAPRRNGLSQHLMGHELQVEPHVWWAQTLYSHYQRNLEEWGNPEGLPPWSYDHPSDLNSLLGTARSHPWHSDDNGTVVYASWTGDAGVVDLCNGDRILRRLNDFGTQYLIMGNNDLVAVQDSRGAYNLAKGDVKMTEANLNWECIYENYGWTNVSRHGGKISVLNRADGSIRTVYESETILAAIQSSVQNVAASLTEVHVPAPTRVEPGTETHLDHRLSVLGISVMGRFLVATVIFSGGPRQYAFVVDMKEDRLLYGIQLTSKSGHIPTPLGGVFRGGVVSYLYRGPYGSPRHCRGILFRPSLPRMDPVTTRLLGLWKECLQQTENPFHRHPSHRIPLHTLLKAPSRRLCCSSEQRFLFRLHFVAAVENLPGQMVTPLVWVDRQGRVCHKSLEWATASASSSSLAEVETEEEEE